MFKGTLTPYFFDANSENVGSLESEEVTIKANEKKTITFKGTFKDGVVDKSYYVYLRNETADEWIAPMSKALISFVLGAPSGLESHDAGTTSCTSPVKNTMTVKSENPIRFIRVYAVNGSDVKQAEGMGLNTVNVDLTSLQAGIYFVKIATNKGVVVKRIIKK